MKRKRTILSSIFVFIAAFLLSGTVMADTSVSWLTPPNGTSLAVGTIVNPTGVANCSGQQGGTGLDLALVIDESGSMSGTPLAQVKTAAISLVNALPQDTTSVAVIGFDSSSHTYRLLTALNPNKASVITAINSIAAGGSTNIGAGISAATTALVSGHTIGRAMMEVVLSDGVGTYSGQAATAYNNFGIVTHTVGVPGHSVSQMTLIANEGHGIYTNVTDMSTLEALFNGTGGNLVGIDHVDITMPNGSLILSIPTDGLGNFSLPDWAMQLGANEFIATAYCTDGNSASAMLTLNGTGGPGPVPEPATMMLFGLGLIGLAGMSRKK